MTFLTSGIQELQHRRKKCVDHGEFMLKNENYLVLFTTPPLGQDMTQGEFFKNWKKKIFKAEFNRFEFRVFLLLD